ncbi:MAG: glycerol-3-phosphate dehydrogenase [SAR86 cluster bacterium]|uniref:Glycerol-3-phosphate dehydrogenase n=1 Tax=SAR86 cluster bacterium TaxID=2030880 RepID=A0A2A5B500_9GAMM|nr:MAG: glycerol-3-phosphate dehydrogenase [SAR86 cluster bacterium]
MLGALTQLSELLEISLHCLKTRRSEVTQSQNSHDLLIIGGGINGVGIAADASGRGLDVVLCEKADLASATSSSSSKLIHGGLRYLENYEFAMVRKSLKERELLIEAAPHVIQPMAFHIPQLPHSRSGLLLRAGLFLYDNLASRKRFGRSRGIRMDDDGPLNSAIRHGFEYWDAQVDDSRLVVLNALQAKKHGANIQTRTECTAIEAGDQGWSVTLSNKDSNVDTKLNVKAIVNATGPWVASVEKNIVKQAAAHNIRMVKGSHIVVPRIHSGKQAYLLQHHDGRVIFVIPYLQKYSLVGTTDQEFTGDPDQAEISNEEITYLISIVNLYFKKSILRSDIVYSFAGVRPLIEELGKDASSVSRDYRLELGTQPHPLLSIYGGKVTTYRILAEEAMNKLQGIFPDMGPAWTSKAKLPGGDFDLPENLFGQLTSRYAWLGPDIISRWQNSYGTISFEILGDAKGTEDLGVKFGQNLYQKEVDYLCNNEWAKTADDILWRRSKLGYGFSRSERTSLANYIEQSFPPS